MFVGSEEKAGMAVWRCVLLIVGKAVRRFINIYLQIIVLLND